MWLWLKRKKNYRFYFRTFSCNLSLSVWPCFTTLSIWTFRIMSKCIVMMAKFFVLVFESCAQKKMRTISNHPTNPHHTNTSIIITHTHKRILFILINILFIHFSLPNDAHHRRAHRRKHWTCAARYASQKEAFAQQWCVVINSLPIFLCQHSAKWVIIIISFKI